MIIAKDDEGTQQSGRRHRVIPVLLIRPSVVVFQQKLERLGWLINGDQPRGDFRGHIGLGGVDGMIIGNRFSLRDVQSVCGVLEEA